MTVTSNIILTVENSDIRSASGYFFNPLVALYTFPRQMDFNDFMTNYQSLNANNVMEQNIYANYHFLSNPNWVLNKQPKDDRIKRAISSLNINYQLSEKLSFQARASYDYSNKTYEQQHAATSNPTNTGDNGRWDYKRINDELFYADGILNYTDDLSDDISLTLIAGASIQHQQFGEGVNVSSGNDGLLFYANEFNFQNLPTNVQVQSALGSRIEKQALFGNAVIGYKDYLFLDIAGRNDYASTSVSYTHLTLPTKA